MSLGYPTVSMGQRLCALLAGAFLTPAVQSAEPPAAPVGTVTAAPVGTHIPEGVPAAPDPVATARDAEDAELFASPTRLDHIGRVVAPVMINGQGPFRFIVDTGASRSTISPQLALKLGLHPSTDSSIRLNGITGSAEVPAVMVARLQAGDLAVENTDFPLVWATLMGGADGILGAAGLTKQRLSVDFQRNRVVIARAGRTHTPPGYLRIPAVRLPGGLVAVDARVGRVRLRAVIDTGSERTLANLALRNALYAQERPGVAQRVTSVYGATAAVTPGELLLAPTISIGPARIADISLVYGDFHIFEVWGMEEKPALILGMDVLGTLTGFVIDFENAELYLQGSGIMDTGTNSMQHYSFDWRRPR